MLFHARLFKPKKEVCFVLVFTHEKIIIFHADCLFPEFGDPAFEGRKGGSVLETAHSGVAFIMLDHDGGLSLINSEVHITNLL